MINILYLNKLKRHRFLDNNVYIYPKSQLPTDKRAVYSRFQSTIAREISGFPFQLKKKKNLPKIHWSSNQKMDGRDFEVEKARLLSLALDFGFDEQSAKKSLDRLISLYGTSHHFFYFYFHFSFLLG